MDVYREERAGRLDFAELEIAAIDLLTSKPELCDEVNARIKYLLIDEFQDTNPTQEKLFRQLITEADTSGAVLRRGRCKAGHLRVPTK